MRISIERTREMKEKKFVKKWRIIKLSKTQHSDISSRFLHEALRSLENADKLLHSVAFKVGREKGMEVRKSIGVDSIRDAVELISMISGVGFEEVDDAFVFHGCPVFPLTDVRNEMSCRGFLEGFFSAIGVRARVEVKCAEKTEKEGCVVKILKG